MKQTVLKWEFQNWFEKHRPNNFSRAGINALWEYLEEYEESTDEEINFDPIALCCEYTEYGNIDDFYKDYDPDKYPDKDEIRDWTQVIEFGTESFIIQNF